MHNLTSAVRSRHCRFGIQPSEGYIHRLKVKGPSFVLKRLVYLGRNMQIRLVLSYLYKM